MREASRKAGKGPRRLALAALACSLSALPGTGAALAQESAQAGFGENVDVVNSFVRVLMPAGETRPWAHELQVTWRGRPQRVVSVVGGSQSTLELGIAVDESGSVHEQARELRATARRVLERSVGGRDRAFVLRFGETFDLVGAGRGEIGRVLDAIPLAPKPGPTAFFAAITAALERFENADPRAGLVLLSDGCDTATAWPNGKLAARLARVRAIPVFLLRPSSELCRNITCTTSADGEWSCEPAPYGGQPYWRYEQTRNTFRRLDSFVESAAASGVPSRARTEFLRRVHEDGGRAFALDRDGDLETTLASVLEVLSRQWMVVFEPTADRVGAEEVSVTLARNGRRTKLR